MNAATVAVVAMDVAEARQFTARITSAADQLWLLLLESHDRRAWAMLGYPSWRVYDKAEFGMGQSHAYRLLDQGCVVRALEAAANSHVGNVISEKPLGISSRSWRW
jgi:hypothetical protein